MGLFSLRHRVQIRSGAQWVPVALTPGEGPGHEADYSCPTSAEVKNAWNYSSTPPIRLHVVLLG
jgi:hypothetical protein